METDANESFRQARCNTINFPGKKGEFKEYKNRQNSENLNVVFYRGL